MRMTNLEVVQARDCLRIFALLNELCELGDFVFRRLISVLVWMIVLGIYAKSTLGP